ncbi:nucleosome assembly protein [Podospora aff. communis PSN243]|uniref:Nucleosome assembly protein n=1 Tax=Podospora aff. communis PSN243 TaxID=3040156 RepID=A0AAV9GWZ0_9PEZI|nr:nucleosome assembly protein [Podospora aff. communis PSN243]
MAASEESTITYQQLSDLEREFDDVETEIIRQQVRLTKPLYEKRKKVISQIPGFWPLVIEQAPPDIDEYIQPTDSALILSFLTGLSVEHFEVESGGDPRSVAIRFEFSENEYFEDRVIEKKFWWRRAKDNWHGGLVSEPVEIKWKEGKDPTEGLLGLAKAVWDEEQAEGANGAAKGKKKPLTEKQQALKAKIDANGLGGLSFFTWFGYRGEPISAEESRVATREEKERRQRRAAGEEVATPTNEEEEEEEEDDEDEFLEIFPNGDSLALAISDDLWPGAIKYFTQAQENDDLSDANFESDEDIEDAELPESEDEDERPSKKRKA